MQLYTGKQTPRIDKRTLKLAKYVSIHLEYPEKVDYSSGIQEWGMMLNDKIGCCTIAGPAHLIMSWTCGKVIIPDEEILKTYQWFTYYDPISGRNDTGCNMLDVHNYWNNIGIAGRKSGAYASVGMNEADIKTALYLFNGLNIGVALPDSAETQFMQGKPWKIVKHAQLSGGHCIALVPIYDTKYYYGVTWGKLVQIEKTWLEKYMMDNREGEAYAVISEDYITGGKTKQGFDMDTLINDLKLIA